MAYDVFLSHSSDDKPAVLVLGQRLEKEARLGVFLDDWHLGVGKEIVKFVLHLFHDLIGFCFWNLPDIGGDRIWRHKFPEIDQERNENTSHKTGKKPYPTRK